MSLGTLFGAPSAPAIPPPLEPRNPEDIIREALREQAGKSRKDRSFFTINPLTGLSLSTQGGQSSTTNGPYVPPSP